MNKLGYHIKGSCGVCHCQWLHRHEKKCVRCDGTSLIIHAFLLTMNNPDVLCEHETKDDPKPKQSKYNNYKKSWKKGKR